MSAAAATASAHLHHNYHHTPESSCLSKDHSFPILGSISLLKDPKVSII